MVHCCAQAQLVCFCESCVHGFVRGTEKLYAVGTGIEDALHPLGRFGGCELGGEAGIGEYARGDDFVVCAALLLDVLVCGSLAAHARSTERFSQSWRRLQRSSSFLIQAEILPRWSSWRSAPMASRRVLVLRGNSESSVWPSGSHGLLDS